MFTPDPTNENYAVMDDGELGVAVRLVEKIADPTAPTVSELTCGQIIGYAHPSSIQLHHEGKS